MIEIIEKVHKGILKNNTGKSNSEEFEIQIQSNLNMASGQSGKLGTQFLDSNNRMTNLVNSGSKGSALNIGQMIACVGQQSVDGKRIPYGFTDRTLPHFHKFDDGAAARGFVENSFVRGLTPTEFYFHAMGGREGLIDTAVKTSETGYIQRKLVKGMEDIRVCFDHSIRNSKNCIIQFLYGEDGVDPTKIEKQYIPTVGMDNAAMARKYKLSLHDRWDNYLTTAAMKRVRKYKSSEVSQRFQDFYKGLLDDKRYLIEHVFHNRLNNNGTVYYPINIRRLVHNTFKLLIVTKGKTDLDPLYVLEKLDELRDKLTVTGNFFSENKLLMMLLHCYLAPSVLIKEFSFTKKALDYVIANIKEQFYNSIAQPGTLVGVISAQSIGEPSTQMTLNTFHFAGVSSKSQVTRGLPRFKELLSTTKNVKSPYLSVYLKPEYATSKEKASNIINEISIINIRQLVTECKIYFEPEQNHSSSIDSGVIDIYHEFEDLMHQPTAMQKSPWVLRLEFDKRRMLDKNVLMTDIYYAIISKFNSSDMAVNDDIECVYTDDNANNLIMRIRTLSKLSETTTDCPEEDTICVLRALEKSILQDIVLSGIKNITNASMSREDDIYKFFS